MRTGVDAAGFRDAMATLAAPLTVLTYYDAGRRARGMTVSAVCSLSPAPPRLLVCVNRSGGGHDPVLAARRLCLHVLGPGQQHLATAFAGPGDRFRGLAVRHGTVPELTDVDVRLTLAPDETRDGGDHTILLAGLVRVVAPAIGGGGLVWHQRGAADAVPARLTEKIA
jgi:flavin reductase (DIM6/NTAB) family NADH-FMN oxidoreductase RutF